jgi:hypothetical protein
MEQIFQRIFPMQKVIQFTKADEATHTVAGIVTTSKPDKEGEVCNYPAAKKAYQAWSSEFQKSTANAGQTESLGNIRVQHGDEVGGKVTQLDFDDEDESIYVVSQPIDDEMWGQIADGFYTGFSQGGDYAWRICQECGETVPKPKGNYCGNCEKVVGIEYGPIVAEVSYVDNPCHGQAHFDLVKKDGTHQMVKFQKRSNMNEQEGASTSSVLSEELIAKLDGIVKSAVAQALAKEAKTKRVAGEDLTSDCFAYVGDKDETSSWKLPIKFSTDAKTKSHIRNALARFEQTKGIPEGSKAKVKSKIDAAAKEHGIEVSDEVKKSENFKTLIKNFVEQKIAERLPEDLRKDMYAVSRFAGIIQDLAFLAYGSQWEAEVEQDGSTLPDELQEDLENLVETFLAMAEEESNELTEVLSERIGKVMKVTPTGLDKAYSKAAGTINKIKKAVSDHHEKIAEMNQEHEEKVHGHLDELKDSMCSKTEKSATPSALTKTGVKTNQEEVEEHDGGDMEECDPEEEGTENIAQKGAKAAEVKKTSYSVAEVETLVNDAVNKAVQGVVGALMKGGDEEEEEEEEKPEPKGNQKKATPTAGIGSRGPVIGGGSPVLKVVPVLKEEEGLPQMVKATGTDGDVSQADVAAALQKGDHAAQLRLMRSATPQNAVPATLYSAVGSLGKRRR